MTDWDYVIIGAGSAGCALAGRLTADGRARVLLLEAGPAHLWPWTTIPIGYGLTYYNPRVNWMFTSQPIPGMNGRTNYFPRGKVLGGSSTINAMVYSRGQPSDFDGWEAEGNPGWGWEAVRAAYKAMEDHDLGASATHGAGGPLHVTVPRRDMHHLTDLWVQTCRELGIAPTDDLNGESIEGAGYYQVTTRNGLRESAARAFLSKRPNLSIETGHRATRLILEGRRAVGVATEGLQGPREFRAARGVVVSAGSIGTPQLLMLSGIGPAGHLQDKGIAVAHDLPGVGRNLGDHLCYDHIVETRLPSLNQVLRPLMGKAWTGLKFVLARRGQLAMSVNQGGGYTRSSPDRPVPDLQLYFSPLSYEQAKVGRRAVMAPDPFPGVCFSVSPCKPQSRGEVTLSSADWRDAPLIQPNFLSADEDMAVLLRGARLLRRMTGSRTFGPMIDHEIKPGAAVQSDAEFEADIRNRAYSVFHPVGTCRMGPAGGTNVVDADLAVHGMQGLFVADASIMPEVTSGNTNAPSMLIGWMAGDRLRQRASA